MGAAIITHGNDGSPPASRGVVVDLPWLETVPVPEATDSYTPIPHGDLVRNTFKYADSMLRPHGFVLNSSRYVASHNGERVAFVHAFDAGLPNLNMAIGGVNSYDKSCKVSLAIGAHVTVCTNLYVAGDIRIVRRHTGEAQDYLRSEIVLSFMQLIERWDSIVEETQRLSEIPMTVDEGIEALCMARWRTRDEPAVYKLFPRAIDLDAACLAWHDYFDFARIYGNPTAWSFLNVQTQLMRTISPAYYLAQHTAITRQVWFMVGQREAAVSAVEPAEVNLV